MLSHFADLEIWLQSLWIFLFYLEPMPTRLQCLDAPVVDDDVCDKAYPGMITRRMMCAGYMDGGRDACNVNYYFFFSFLFFNTKSLQRPRRITAPCLRVTWNTVYQLKLISLCLSGWLWQPSGVFRRGPRPGVMGSRMCPAWLPWSLRQSVWVPLLDWGCLCSQPLKKPAISLPTFAPPIHCATTSVLKDRLCLKIFWNFCPVISKREHTCQNVDDKIKPRGLYSLFLLVFSYF